MEKDVSINDPTRIELREGPLDDLGPKYANCLSKFLNTYYHQTGAKHNYDLYLAFSEPEASLPTDCIVCYESASNYSNFYSCNCGCAICNDCFLDWVN
jgi:hypothetical protein